MVFSLLLCAFACRRSDGATERPEGHQRTIMADGKILLVGTVARADVEVIPGWSSEGVEVDETAASQLASVPPGATVVVYFGTWCGDSRRAVPRMFRALEVAGKVPFGLELIGVDERKTAPAEVDLRYVPTFIVRRDGKEVGRIVETAPEGVEAELLHLLDGSKTGLITGRTDL